MSPAFSSVRQAAGFAGLLLFLLFGPLVMRKPWLPPREQLYSAMPWSMGDFPYTDEQIFKETGDIDIAFMGHSRMGWGVDARQMEEQLSRKLGRKAVVRSLCWNSPGCDLMYLVIKDLLEHRKVHCIVTVNCAWGQEAHRNAPCLFRATDNPELFSDLPWRSKVSLYTSAILGAPRNLAGLLRSNLPAIPAETIGWRAQTVIFSNIPNAALYNGSFAVPMRLSAPFVEYNPPTLPPADTVAIYSDTTKRYFHFATNAIWPMQVEILRKIGRLALEHDTQIVFLHVPLLSDYGSSMINEGGFWPEVMRAPVAVVGARPDKLYEGLSRTDAAKLYFNDEHLNQNGIKYFTSVLAPSLCEYYASSAKR